MLCETQLGCAVKRHTARWALEITVVAIAEQSGVDDVAHSSPQRLSGFVDKGEDLAEIRIVRRIAAPGPVPARPDAVDVAMMQPEKWIVGCPRHCTHAALTGPDIDMNRAVRRVVEVRAKAGIAIECVGIDRRHHRVQAKRRFADLVDRAAVIDPRVAIRSEQRLPKRVVR